MSETTYWDSQIARSGKPFATWSEGVLRVLIPNKLSYVLDHIHAAYQVVISHGPFPEIDLNDCYEILFEDGTDDPLVMHLSASGFHSMPNAKDMPVDFSCTVWADEGKVYEFPANYREAKALPLRTPWTEARLLYNDKRLLDQLEGAFDGKFESNFFPHLHRFAKQVTRRAIAKVDWRLTQFADDAIAVVPNLSECIHVFAPNGTSQTISPEAFGIVCVVATYDRLFHEDMESLSKDALQNFRTLVRLMLAHPERSVMMPWEQ